MLATHVHHATILHHTQMCLNHSHRWSGGCIRAGSGLHALISSLLVGTYLMNPCTSSTYQLRTGGPPIHPCNFVAGPGSLEWERHTHCCPMRGAVLTSLPLSHLRGHFWVIVVNLISSAATREVLFSSECLLCLTWYIYTWLAASGQIYTWHSTGLFILWNTKHPYISLFTFLFFSHYLFNHP